MASITVTFMVMIRDTFKLRPSKPRPIKQGQSNPRISQLGLELGLVLASRL